MGSGIRNHEKTPRSGRGVKFRYGLRGSLQVDVFASEPGFTVPPGLNRSPSDTEDWPIGVDDQPVELAVVANPAGDGFRLIPMTKDVCGPTNPASVKAIAV